MNPKSMEGDFKFVVYEISKVGGPRFHAVYAFNTEESMQKGVDKNGVIDPMFVGETIDDLAKKVARRKLIAGGNWIGSYDENFGPVSAKKPIRQLGATDDTLYRLHNCVDVQTKMFLGQYRYVSTGLNKISEAIYNKWKQELTC